MNSLMTQFQDFFSTAVLGLLVGLVFHFYHLVIRMAGVGRFVLYFLDFLIWLVLIVLVFLALLLINHGEVRVYVLVALVLGGLGYYLYLSRLTAKPLQFGASSLVSGCRFLGRLLLRPVIELKNRISGFLSGLLLRASQGQGDEDDEDKPN